jgi:hypothetical protein
MGMFDDLLPASDGTMPEPKASSGMFDDLLPPAAAPNMFSDLLPPAEEQRSTMADVGVGIVAAPVSVAQGISELGALALDAAFGTDYSKSVTSGFDEFKKEYGLRPQTTAGKMSEDVMAFGVGFIPIAGWLGRASAVARGGAQIAAKSKYLASAEKFGASEAGKKLLNSRLKLSGATIAGSGLYESVVSPDGRQTISDMFDAAPDFLKTDRDSTLEGRDEAFRRLGNRLRFFVEGLGATAAVEAIFPAAAAIGKGVAQTPGVAPAAKVVHDALYNKLGGALGGQDWIRRNFTTAGLAPKELIEGISDTKARVDLATQSAADNLSRFDRELNKAIKGQKLWGKGKLAVKQGYEDLTRYMTGVNLGALDNYAPEVQAAAMAMRKNIDGFSDILMRQIEDAAIPAAQKKELLTEIASNKQAGNYMRRVYDFQMHPERWLDPKVWQSPAYKAALDEGADSITSITRGELTGQAARDEADSIMRRLAGVDVLDTGIDPIVALERRMEGITRGKKALKGGKVPLYGISERMLMDRSAFLNMTPKARQFLGEVVDPKRAYMTTVTDMAELVMRNDMYKYLDQSLGGTFDDVAKGGKPAIVRPESIRDSIEKARMAKMQESQASAGVTSGAIAEEAFDYAGAAARADEALKKFGYIRLGGEPSPSAATAPVFKGAYGDMTGAYVLPDVELALSAAPRTQSILNEMWALSLQAKGVSQMSKTVLNPLAQVRNAISGAFLIAANGNLGREMNVFDTMRVVMGSYANLSDPAFKDFYNRMISLGLKDENMSIREYRALLREGSEEGVGLKVAGKTGAAAGKAISAVPGIKQALSTAEKIYGGTDTYWKLVGYTAEKSKYSNAFSKLGLNVDNLSLDGLADDLVEAGIAPRSSQALGRLPFMDVMAADIVKATMPTYSRVPEFIKSLRKIPVVGNFTAFPAEVIRNTANIFDQGLKELSFTASPKMIEKLSKRLGSPEAGAKAAASLERDIRAIGAQRMMGYLGTAIGAGKTLKHVGMELTGMNQEQMEALELNAGYWMKGHDLIPLSPVKDGMVEYVDFSYMNPYDFMIAPAMAAMQVYRETGNVTDSDLAQVGNAAWAALSKYVEPFGSESLVAERLLDVLPSGRKGETQTGAKIYRESDDFGTKMERSFNHILAGFTPAALDLVVQERGGKFESGRLTRAIYDVPGKNGEKYSTFEEAATMLTGMRGMKLDLKNNFYYAGAEYSPLRTAAKSDFNAMARRNDATDEDIVQSFGSYIDNMYRLQSNLYAKVQAARALGLSENDIRSQLLKDANLGREEVSAVMRGRFQPSGFSKDLQQELRREVYQKGQRRLVTNLPMADLRAIEQQNRNRELDPNIPQPEKPSFMRQLFFPDQGRPASTGMFDDLIPQNKGAALPRPVVAPAPAPAVPQTPQAPAKAAPISPSLLGSDPVTQARNAEIAARQSGQ